MKTYLIKEIFGPTLQGEGSYTGVAVKFLRFSVCNRWTGKEKDRYRAVCWFCDTDFDGGVRITASAIVDALDDLGPVRTVVISGGEPTLQLDTEILEALTRAGYKLHLETNGSKDIGELAGFFDHITMSPKQARHNTVLKSCHDLKVLFPQVIPGVTPDAFNDFPAKRKYVQPVDSAEGLKNTSEAIAYVLKNPSWRLSLQTHKITGVK